VPTVLRFRLRRALSVAKVTSTRLTEAYTRLAGHDLREGCLVLLAAHSAKITVQFVGHNDPRMSAHGYGWPGTLAPAARRMTRG